MNCYGKYDCKDRICWLCEETNKTTYIKCSKETYKNKKSIEDFIEEILNM